MAEPSYSSPIALARSIRDRIRACVAHEAEALFPSRWVIKGGVALHIRLDPSRPSLDLDLVDTSDPISREMQVRDLEAVAEVDLADYFRFKIERASIDTDEYGSMTVSVKCYIGAEPFEDFDIDLAPFDATSDSELFPLALPIVLNIAYATVEVSILLLEGQLADKICAMFERHGQEQAHSSRWRDLADVAIWATLRVRAAR